LWNHFWEQASKYYDNPNHNYEKIDLSIQTILNGDFTAASALITFGAVLGKCSLFQLFGIASIHAILYGLNRAIILNIFKANDAGGTMIIHLFGASFGLAASLFY
jgi:ammonium transporter Rh